METRDWIQEKFGTNDPESLLDEDVYSTKELRQDKKQLQITLNRIANGLEEHEQKYKKLLKAGKNADTEADRRQYATKAKFEKKKYKAKKKKHKATSIKLGTIVAVEGMRDILEMQHEVPLSLEAELEDVDTQELESQIIDEMAAFGLEIDDMKEVQQALDIEILDDDLETEVSEELQLMREMEAEELQDDQIQLDAETDDEIGDLDVDVDIDI